MGAAAGGGDGWAAGGGGEGMGGQPAVGRLTFCDLLPVYLCDSPISTSPSPNPSNRQQMGWLRRFTVAAAFLAAGVIFSPGTFGSASGAGGFSPFLKLAHLLYFPTAWGAALWNLPLHQFGNLQSKMFPAYFTLVGVCSAVSVAAFGYFHPLKSAAAIEKYQLGFLAGSFLFNLSNLLIFTPMTIQVALWTASWTDGHG